MYVHGVAAGPCVGLAEVCVFRNVYGCEITGIMHRDTNQAPMGGVILTVSSI